MDHSCQHPATSHRALSTGRLRLTAATFSFYSAPVTTRRQLFRKTFLGAALLAGGAAVPLALRRTRLNATPPGRPLQFFSAEEYAIFAAIAERVVALEPTAAAGALEPTAAADGREPGAASDLPLPEPLAKVAASRPPGPTAAQVNVAGKADAFLAPLDAQSAKDLKQLISLFDNALVSVLFDNTADHAREFFANNGGDWPVVMDDDGAVGVAYGVARVPESFLVAPTGIVVQRLVGGVTQAQLDDLIAQYEAARA